MAAVFVHRANETHPGLIICSCAVCGVLVGASPSNAFVKMVEELHQCATLQPTINAASGV